MPSNASIIHLADLQDADELVYANDQFRAEVSPPQQKIDALNRAIVIMAVSAWEAYVEELVCEAVAAMRPSTGVLGSWSVHYAAVLGQAKRFHTPDPDNVKALIADALGLSDIHPTWTWSGTTSVQAVQALWRALKLRHQIAHGINPRPMVDYPYASQLRQFFRKLGQATDQAVRNHLVNVLGMANPWPP